MRAYLIDVWNKEAKVVEKDWNLEEYYKAIDCRCIDIAVRTIGHHPFNIVLDDEGLFRENTRFGACEMSGIPALAGTLVMFGLDSDTYDLASLTDHEVELIKRRMVWLVDLYEGEGYPCVLID